MDRKKFLQKGLLGLGTIVAIPSIITSCSKDRESGSTTSTDSSTGNCSLSPSETAGPFPIKTPAQLVRENIVGDRSGVTLLINLTVQDQSNNCQPMAGVLVDIWHCDAEGNYSQYGGGGMQQANYTSNNFLRGRSTTDKNGQVSFISIFPGWYKGRAPHIHLEILNANGSSIRVSQIAFPKSVCDTVYATTGYKGVADTQNESDNVFSDSLSGNMLDDIKGDVANGYTLTKTIVV
ncbi:intradiol ring-cleavage dioxygenase [Riemerella anatipestifer]|uniref:Intradiol ring-cleavage dioxygenase n=1 Tax=Riemerella anatipestifer (strain ATCC 11845 / DSM 15868 / JCM 9532 / NCTC 11014) TaxID=693978 RepID=E4TBC1_RIEAD|nr:intradiol ring-cleavage dioxygenase [Riemerella anatipestifer]ADQ81425.1 intradiol ring-cleavage dioxygenase [Riemerella anatipestifer ATCC 11845 = DSM 15868]ADZ13078.1 Protocatechuate 3,4-dioxygenase beta subunit [Riemerella anatipestifer RA-GD]AFD55439.1 intradiol ring-cleavage dioxygenase [Riemerella anatipestifer ATCC 11845 = DSM 15868]AGC40679.1 hypothetical protein G148_1375 [Riemerella anatipestifer RA-CH-2]AKP68703.1 intradiol ring-cleavage dioxygenase [Riemerella anatipestifer]